MWPKIISSFLTVLVIFVISFLTFSSTSWTQLDYYSKFNIPKEWTFSILKDKKWEFKEFEVSKNSQIFMDRFNYIDKIFYSKKWSYTKNQVSNNVSFKVWKGKYFFSFAYPRKYEVSWSGFNLTFNWPIKLYINSENIDSLDIFSTDNITELTLLWLIDNKPKTKVYIYPHMLFTFNLNLNKILANSDWFRVSQLNSISYVNQNLYSNLFSLEKFPNLDNYFFKSVLIYSYSEFTNNNIDDSILKENFNNMTYDYIKKYFSIFINNNKKTAYYKDLIYMNLLKIYMSSENSDSIYSDTESYFNKLKELNQNEYNNMVKILTYFKSKFLSDNSLQNIEKEIKYDKILWWVLWFKKLEWNYMLYYIFNLYDLWKNDKFFNWIISFSDTFLWSNWLKIEEDKLLWYNDSQNIKLGYYISFLENLIRSHLIDSFDNDKIKGIIEIFNKYSLLSANIYSTWKADSKKTAMVLHLNLLKDLSEYIRNTFFEKDLERSVMLVKKQNINIDNDTISLLDKGYNNLLNFFTNNKWAFDESSEKDNLYIKEYEFISINFLEYLSALKNYDKYKTEKNDLYNIKTIWWGNIKKVFYTVDDITNYLAGFNWVDQNSIKIKTDAVGNIFSIALNIWWKDFSFDLYPYDNYLVNNIYIDWVKKSFSYPLGLIKEQMDKKFESSSKPEDKNLNDFKNFFINTFLKTKSNNFIDPNNEIDTPLPRDSTEILVFKRDKLLWQNWEFYVLKDFSQIGMNNIIVSSTDIKLKDAKFFFTFSEWSNNSSSTYGAYLTSDYFIKDHYFNNIRLKIYKNINDWNRNVEQFWLWKEKYISIVWNLGILSLRDFMSNLLTYYNNIVFVNNTLSERVSNIEISISSSKVIKFSFSYNGKSYELSLLKSSVINLKRDWEKIITTTFNYTDLPNRIDLLLK